MISYHRWLITVLVKIWMCCWAGAAVFTIFFPGQAIDVVNSVPGLFDKHPGYARLKPRLPWQLEQEA